MKRSEAARYARWSAAAAVLLALATIAVYLQHGFLARLQRKGAPPAAPQNVERQSAGLAFSKMEGDRKVFTVEASKSTEFRNQDGNLLEEVKITIFGKHSERNDTIRTHSCKYTKANGTIFCSGTVQIDLQTAAEAELAKKRTGTGAAAPVSHVETRSVSFEQATGTAHTDQPVTFAFPAGTGQATGVEYNSEAGTMKLLRDVNMKLIQSGGPKSKGADKVLIHGASLDFNRDTRILHLIGPAHAESSAAKLDAGEITLNLDEDYRAEKLLATAGAQGSKPRVVSSAATAPMKLTANNLTASFDAAGWLKKLDAAGSVNGSRHTANEDDDFASDNASVDLWPEFDEPKQINLNGSVVVKTKAKNGESRLLETSKLRMEFTAPTESDAARPKRAETLAAGTVQWIDAAGSGGTSAGPGSRTKLQAEKFVVGFVAGTAKQLAATGSVQAQREIPGNEAQIATASRGLAQLIPAGGWSQLELQDHVKLKQGDRSGQADRAVAVRAAQTMTLMGQAVVRDAATETHAANIIFMQATGDIRAEGGVRSTASPSKGAAPQFAAVPANITAEKMQANAKTGRALYSGHARLWQGESVLESDSIELLQKEKQLNAAGNVRAVFPQAVNRDPGILPASNKTAKRAALWHLAAETLTYQELENRAHLERNVVVQSDAERMRSAILDIYFTRTGQPGTPGKPSNGPAGAQQISRAVGTGGVVVQEQNRKATAERAEFTAADGKFVMSGGNPTLFDGVQGTTTGRQLTFFLADDTIIVDSENGSRTLTKHRVEK